MRISNHHNRRIQSIIKQFGEINQTLEVKGLYGDVTATWSFNPSTFSFDRLRLIFKFLSGFPTDKVGDPISFMDITSKELVECEERFSALIGENGVMLPIFDEEWDRIIQQYNR